MTDLRDRPITPKMRELLYALMRLREANKYPASPAEIAYEMGYRLGPERRRGPAPGRQSPAQYIITTLGALRNRGFLDLDQRRDGLSGVAYSLTTKPF